MRISKSLFFIFWMLFLAHQSACVRLSELSSPDGLVLAPALPPESSRAFQKALRFEPPDEKPEQARIEYLLEQISRSPYNFIRNNDRYSGKKAQAHLRWKHVRNFLKIKTAEDFIKYAATRSKTSGEYYLVEFPDHKRVRLAPLLFNELESFDERVAKERRRLIKAEAERKAKAEAEKAPA